MPAGPGGASRAVATVLLAVAIGCGRSAPPASAADTDAELAAVVTGLYELWSGPAGDRDWDAISARFLRGATMHGLRPATADSAAWVRSSPFEQWRDGAKQYFASGPLYERVLNVRTMVAHDVGYVTTEFESRIHPDSAPYQRGMTGTVLYRTPIGWRIATSVHLDLAGTDIR